MLLLHGLGASAATTWREAGWLDLLADEGRTVVAPDLPGHGATPMPDGELDLATFALDQLPGDEPVDAVGFSLGGRTLLLAAARAPERFRRVVVAGIGANILQPGAMHDTADAIDAGDTEHPMARYFLDHALRSGTDPSVLSRHLREARPPVTAGDLATLTMPVLVVIGDRDIAGPGEPLADALPDGRCVTLPGVDHFSTPKQFGFLEAALDFLAAP